MRLLRLLWRGWMLLGAALGYINTRVILFVIFFLLLTPIAIGVRLARKPRASQWHERAVPEDTEQERLHRLH